MPRKKIISKNKVKDETKKEIKLEIVGTKKQPLLKKRKEADETELENLIEEPIDISNFRFSPSLRMRQAVTIEPLEIDLSDVPTKKNENDDKLYASVKGGNYSPKDNYQIAGVKSAYEESVPREVGQKSITSNFSTSNFGAPRQDMAFNNTETSPYPGSEQRQGRQYETSIEDKAKEERKRTV